MIVSFSHGVFRNKRMLPCLITLSGLESYRLISLRVLGTVVLTTSRARARGIEATSLWLADSWE